MELIAGTIILKNNKVLMVRENKKECYGKWAFPAGHVEVGETIIDGAQRELLEETGCKANLKKAFPIIMHNHKDKVLIMVHFLADLIDDNSQYNKEEIQEIKWIDIDEIKKMNKEEFRAYSVIKTIMDSLEDNKLYDLELFINC